MQKIRDYNLWIRNILSLSEKEREEVLNEVVLLLKEAKRHKSAEFLTSNDCELVGFEPFLEYVRINPDRRGSGEQLANPFNHCWATYVVIVWHRKWKCFIHVGPCIEWNESTFGQEVIGATG